MAGKKERPSTEKERKETQQVRSDKAMGLSFYLSIFSIGQMLLAILVLSVSHPHPTTL